MNKKITGKIFGFASGLVLFAMLFSPSASVVRYVSAEEVLPPIVIEVVDEKKKVLDETLEKDIKEELVVLESATIEEAPVVIEEIAVDDAVICSVLTNPVVVVEDDYFEYQYGTNLLVILSDLNLGKTATDPNGDPFTLVGNFINPFIVGGLTPAVGVYTYRYTATDIYGCIGLKDITIVIGPHPDMICNETNRPFITSEEIYRYPTGASLLSDILFDFESFFSVSDPDHSFGDLKNESAFINNLSGGLTIDDGDYVYHVSFMDPTGCRGEKDFTIRVGPDPVVPNNGGGGNGGGGNSSGSSSSSNSGTVLGVTTGGEVLGETTCAPYITTYMRMGIVNNVNEVKKLQTFLNQEMGANLPVTGMFKKLTDQAVRNFQNKYKTDVLAPWGKTNSTGLVYKTTQTKINNIMCVDLNIPIPTNLIPFSQYLKTQ